MADTPEDDVVRVMAFSALQAFWNDPKSPQGSEQSLRTWYKITEAATWRNFGELKNTFRSTDKVGDCYVFDVGHNDIRLIAYVRFADAARSGLVLIRKVMDHPEYDKNSWSDECGCHKARPKKSGARPVKRVRKKK